MATSTGRTNKRSLASLATFTSPLVATTQGQAQGQGQQQAGRKPTTQSPSTTAGDSSAAHINGDVGAMASFNEPDSRRDTEMGSDNDSEVCDLALDGAQEDEALKNADALTEQEVARRRLRRVNQLMKLYRMHYWGLLEELRSKYRVFYIKHGKGGWKDDVEAAEKEKMESTVETLDGQDNATKGKLLLGDGAGAMKEPLAPDKSVGEIVKCAYQGCKSKPLALSRFCFAHILLEPRQQLYRPCSFVIKSGQSGSVTCGKPVLRSLVPAHCAAHIQRQSSRGMRKASSNAAPKQPGPKLHLVIAEYVRLIQCKRRAARDASLKNVANMVSIKEMDGAVNAVIQQEQVLPSASTM